MNRNRVQNYSRNAANVGRQRNELRQDRQTKLNETRIRLRREKDRRLREQRESQVQDRLRAMGGPAEAERLLQTERLQRLERERNERMLDQADVEAAARLEQDLERRRLSYNLLNRVIGLVEQDWEPVFGDEETAIRMLDSFGFWDEIQGADDIDRVDDYWSDFDHDDNAEIVNERVAHLRKENEESSSLRFSCACRVCLTEAPRERSVYTRCGHAVCRECADDFMPLSANGRDSCLVCSKESNHVPLFETESDENASTVFSRSCCVCYAETPRQRAVFTSCGHVICLACAEQMNASASSLTCPFCRVSGDFIKLDEQIIPDINDF